MQVFALDTEIGNIKRRFIGENEEEILTAHNHKFHLFVIFLGVLAATIIVLFLVILLGVAGAPPWVPPLVLLIWTLGALTYCFLKFLSQHYSFILVTSRKVVDVDQGLFRERITSMNLDNISTVTHETKLLNIFAFGTLVFTLKQPPNSSRAIRYVRHAQEVAARITDNTVNFQPMVRYTTGVDARPEKRQ